MALEIIQDLDVDTDLGRYDNDGPDGLPNSGDDDGYVDFLFIVMRSTPPGSLSEKQLVSPGWGWVMTTRATMFRSRAEIYALR